MLKEAGIYAGLKTEKETLSDQQQEALKEVNLTDVCNFYMGTLAVITDNHTGRRDQPILDKISPSQFINLHIFIIP